MVMVRNFKSIYRSISLLFGSVGGIVLICMMLITVCDVVGRYFFNRPITGVYEITECMMVVIVFLFFGHTQATKGHINIDFIVMRLPDRLRLAVAVFTHVVSLVMVIILTWMSIIRWTELMDINEHTTNLNLPISPFMLILCIGLFAYFLELLKDVINLFKRKEI
jgi:TRAP-type C4-dicarboxylate transport system permease small subunit